MIENIINKETSQKNPIPENLWIQAKYAAIRKVSRTLFLFQFLLFQSHFMSIWLHCSHPWNTPKCLYISGSPGLADGFASPVSVGSHYKAQTYYEIITVGNTASSSNRAKNPFTVIPNSQEETKIYLSLNIFAKRPFKKKIRQSYTPAEEKGKPKVWASWIKWHTFRYWTFNFPHVLDSRPLVLDFKYNLYLSILWDNKN